MGDWAHCYIAFSSITAITGIRHVDTLSPQHGQSSCCKTENWLPTPGCRLPLWYVIFINSNAVA